MLRSLCKGVGCCIRTSPVCKLYFLQNPSSSSSILPTLRCISSKTSTNRHSFTVSYLINTCGFSPESALSVSKHVHLKTPDRPNSVINFFKNHGFSDAQILSITRRFPKVLLINPNRTLLPKLQFLLSKGASSLDVAKIISSNPWLLRCSVENQLAPNFNFFKELLQSNEKTMAAIKRFTRMLACDLKAVTSNLNMLRDNGVPEKTIGFIVSFLLTTIVLNPEKLKKFVEEVREMGFDPSESQFGKAIHSLRCCRSTWEEKLDEYRRWGLSEEEIIAAFRKSPFFMTLSQDKIMAVMDLFVNKLGWEPSWVAKFPSITTYSFKKRLTPRASVLQFLVSKGLLGKNFRSIDIFIASEKKFLHRFVNCYDESTQILKIYREQLDHSR